jgi:hypothetical protein
MASLPYIMESNAYQIFSSNLFKRATMVVVSSNKKG